MLYISAKAFEVNFKEAEPTISSATLIQSILKVANNNVTQNEVNKNAKKNKNLPISFNCTLRLVMHQRTNSNQKLLHCQRRRRTGAFRNS